jgi:hypothetical protein
MRTAVSNAASLRRLRWQAAFAKTYRTSSPVLWQHLFVSDTPMTNWSGGSSLFLNWAAEKTPPGRQSQSAQISRAKDDSSRIQNVSVKENGTLIRQ